MNIIDKLPKTRDGAAIIPNEIYWMVSHEGVVSVRVRSIEYDESGWTIIDHDGYCWEPEEFYETEALADAAAEGGK